MRICKQSSIVYEAAEVWRVDLTPAGLCDGALIEQLAYSHDILGD